MPIAVSWGNPEHTILRLDFDDPWDWADYQAAIITTTRIMEPIHHPVTMVVSANTIERLPQGALSHFRQSDLHVPDNLSEIYIVSTNPLVELLITTLEKISPRLGGRLRLTSSLAEAYSHIGREPAPPT